VNNAIEMQLNEEVPRVSTGCKVASANPGFQKSAEIFTLQFGSMQSTITA
jgi:hypothetical protein